MKNKLLRMNSILLSIHTWKKNWEVEYYHWFGYPGTQIAFMHFMSNGNYAIDITKREYEIKTGKEAKKEK